MEDNPWDKKYLYYTNEHPMFNSVMKIDTDTMTLKADIHVWGFNPHSVDRACYTDKMYVRTQSSHSFAVIDARTEKCLKVVDLPFKPRSCGDQNYKYNLQLVGGTSDPGVALIDVDTDEVIFVAWEPAAGRKPLGNQGGSAAGHAVWFDDMHFGYLDRLGSLIKVYRLTNGNSNRVTHIQTLNSPTALHSIQDDKIDTNLTTKTLYGTIEGYVGDDTHQGQTPGIVKYSWDPDRDSPLKEEQIIRLPNSDNNDTIHHYSITSDGNELWVPTYWSRQIHKYSLPDLTHLDSVSGGYGGGHVNFSDELNLVVVTNHFDTYITIVNRDTMEVVNVNVNRRYAEATTGTLLQTHSNHITEDGIYFIVGNSQDGDFVKVDLRYYKVKYRLFVGGHPEQSIS